MKVGKVAGPFLLSGVIGSVTWILASNSSNMEIASYVLILIAFLFLCLLASGAIYLYIVLSGGVMSRTERQTHEARSR